MDLHDALTQITEIRQQLARTEVFRGYRAVPITFSGILALAVAGFQALWLPQPAEHVGDYLVLWIAAAMFIRPFVPAESSIMSTFSDPPSTEYVFFPNCSVRRRLTSE